MKKKSNQVYMVKLSDTENVTVYGAEDDLAHVAASVKMFMRWLPAGFQYLAVSTVTGGSGDHPNTGRVRYATKTETAAFLKLMETVEAEPIPDYSVQ